jgi:hypothetical protein
MISAVGVNGRFGVERKHYLVIIGYLPDLTTKLRSGRGRPRRCWLGHDLLSVATVIESPFNSLVAQRLLLGLVWGETEAGRSGSIGRKNV